MNIFVFSSNVKLNASLLCNKHVVKMTLETAQLLCTAMHSNGSKSLTIPYKATHTNHPCAIWVRQSQENYLWTCNYGLAIAKEYAKRYGKQHKSKVVIDFAKDNCYNLKFDDVLKTEFVFAGPKYYDDLPIATYQKYLLYYWNDKKYMFDLATKNKWQKIVS